MGPLTCSAAAAGGHLATLQWAVAHGCVASQHARYRAASGGHLEVLQWLLADHEPPEGALCCAAASGGHVEVLEWLHSEGHPCDAATHDAAAYGGQLAALRWLHRQAARRATPSAGPPRRPAGWDMLQWARSHGRPWLDAAEHAARSGHLAVLQWAVAHGCPCDRARCRAVATDDSVIEWLQ